LILGFSVIIISLSLGIIFCTNQFGQQNENYLSLSNKYVDIQKQLADQIGQYQVLSQTDQILKNRQLTTEIAQIKSLYLSLETTYEQITDLRAQNSKTTDFEKRFAEIFNLVGQFKYTESSDKLKLLSADLQKKTADLAAVPNPSTGGPVNNSAPTSAGSNRQTVEIDSGKYLVDIISADLSNTKVIVDTASDSTCTNGCPVDSLGNYATRSGAFAGINGPFFCPESYPTCAGKTNSFDTLLMNKNKVYFNSDNNVYSSVPAAIFSTTSRFVEQSSQWGRDTSIDSVIAGQPLLVFNGQSRFSGNDDVKLSGKGNRSFIGNTDNIVYIGIVHNASVAESALVLAKMGIKNAINLDSGGSTAMWSNGKYLAGPGRNTPFGILFVKR
jgi:exopolysaccharide biosynthesis protein